MTFNNRGLTFNEIDNINDIDEVIFSLRINEDQISREELINACNEAFTRCFEDARKYHGEELFNFYKKHHRKISMRWDKYCEENNVDSIDYSKQFDILLKGYDKKYIEDNELNFKCLISCVWDFKNRYNHFKKIMPDCDNLFKPEDYLEKVVLDNMLDYKFSYYNFFIVNGGEIFVNVSLKFNDAIKQWFKRYKDIYEFEDDGYFDIRFMKDGELRYCISDDQWDDTYFDLTPRLKDKKSK